MADNERSGIQFILAVVLICAAVVTATVYLVDYVNNQCTQIKTELSSDLQKHESLPYHLGMPEYVGAQLRELKVEQADGIAAIISELKEMRKVQLQVLDRLTKLEVQR